MIEVFHLKSKENTLMKPKGILGLSFNCKSSICGKATYSCFSSAFKPSMFPDFVSKRNIKYVDVDNVVAIIFKGKNDKIGHVRVCLSKKDMIPSGNVVPFKENSFLTNWTFCSDDGNILITTSDETGDTCSIKNKNMQYQLNVDTRRIPEGYATIENGIPKYENKASKNLGFAI